VPHFLFLGRPSQVQFPIDSDEDIIERVKSQDRVAVLNIFKLVLDATSALCRIFR
jgi:hypothetical protein